MKSLASRRLYGILDLGYVTPERAPEMAAKMLEGGVEILQLRAKGATEDEIVRLALQVASLCRDAGVPFILNDHPHLVRRVGADGAHVGQDDLSVAEARALAGPGALIGKSTHGFAQALQAAAEGPDYLGFGPLFATPTKPEYVPIGTKEIREVHAQVTLPIFCIGGIKLENLPSVLAAGAGRVVVVSGILQAPDPSAYVRNLKGALAAPSKS